MQYELSVCSRAAGRGQDRFFTLEPKDTRSPLILGVFDGHGCNNQVVDYCEHQFNYMLQQCTCSKLALERLFERVSEGTKKLIGGTTVALACIMPDYRVVVAILGDSMVHVLQKNGNTLQSPQHNFASNQAELTTALARGGRQESVYVWNKPHTRGVQMSRSLGDWEMGDIVLRKPEIVEWQVAPGDCVVLTTDGVYDPASFDERNNYQHLMHTLGTGCSAKDLVDHFQPQTYDDATAIICRIH